jgi:hypothetical protein
VNRLPYRSEGMAAAASLGGSGEVVDDAVDLGAGERQGAATAGEYVIILDRPFLDPIRWRSTL